MEIMDFFIKMLLAVVVGFIIGTEREWRLRNAGLLTNTLVSLGAAVYVMASMMILPEGSVGDPSRVLGQIAAGVGFLGAGVIMRDGMNVHGLNSAATIWCSAAVGSLIGLDLYVIAFIAAGIVVVSNICIRWIAILINKLAIRKKNILAGGMVHFFVDQTNESKFKMEMLQELAKFPTLSLKSFISKKTTLHTEAIEIVCEVLCCKENKADYQTFINAISANVSLLKMYQIEQVNNINV